MVIAVASQRGAARGLRRDISSGVQVLRRHGLALPPLREGSEGKGLTLIGEGKRLINFSRPPAAVVPAAVVCHGSRESYIGSVRLYIMY